MEEEQNESKNEVFVNAEDTKGVILGLKKEYIISFLKKYKIVVTFVVVLLLMIIILLIINFIKNKENNIEIIDKPIIKDTVIDGTTFNVPVGVSVGKYAKNLFGGTKMVMDDNGSILMSQIDMGNVVAIIDENQDGVADKTKVVLSGLNLPSGLDFQCEKKVCWLYVAEKDSLKRYFYDSKNSRVLGNTEMLVTLEGKSIFNDHPIFVDNNLIYIGVGASCNTCLDDEGLASVLVFDLQKRSSRIFATGLRHVTSFEKNKDTGEMLVTEDGRDGIGLNLPPDEINILEDGGRYGWPICYGKNEHDIYFDTNTYIRNPCLSPFEEASFIDLPPHSNPSSMVFVPSNSLYDTGLLVALKGDFKEGAYEPTILFIELSKTGENITNFITGWDENSNISDMIFNQNKRLLILDSTKGIIYMIRFGDLFSNVTSNHIVGVDDGNDDIPTSAPKCMVTGCSSEICSDRKVNSTCIYLPAFECFKKTTCEIQVSGKCGWTHNDDFVKCLEDKA